MSTRPEYPARENASTFWREFREWLWRRAMGRYAAQHERWMGWDAWVSPNRTAPTRGRCDGC